MNPVDLVTPQLINYCIPMNTIVICGFTKTGKVLIAKKLAENLKRRLILSDDYGFENYTSFYDDVINLYNQKIPIIVEGVLCFRLLRKGLKEDTFHPDLILKTECSESTIRYFYQKDGEGDKIDRVLSFNKSLNTIWEEYLNEFNTIPWLRKPAYGELNTSL
jgi:hypothetical protein